MQNSNNEKCTREFLNLIPKAKKYYMDGWKPYKAVLGEKVTSCKSKITNIIEAVNSSIRNSISYLNRRQRTYAKSEENLSKALEAIVFNLNCKLNYNIIKNGFHKALSLSM